MEALALGVIALSLVGVGLAITVLWAFWKVMSDD